VSDYANPLRGPADVADWVAEGPAGVGGDGALELFSTGDEAVLGDRAHFTLWCPQRFGPRVRVEWSFRPLSDEGLAMLFFGAAGIGADLFSPRLAPRDGYYPQYHSGDIRTLHVSYYRRKWPSERRFHTCNLRKSPGFELVASGADPLPGAADADGFYRVRVELDGPQTAVSIDDLPLFRWTDPDPRADWSGRIGFRQMAPLIAQYTNLEVTELA
jgi:hypothetical protein